MPKSSSTNQLIPKIFPQNSKKKKKKMWNFFSTKKKKPEKINSMVKLIIAMIKAMNENLKVLRAHITVNPTEGKHCPGVFCQELVFRLRAEG